MRTFLLGIVLALSAGADSASSDPRAALQPFNVLIGSWRGTGVPEGTAEEKRNGFWTEALSWEWQFKKGGPSLELAFDKGKHFTHASLRYLPDRQRYELTVTAPNKSESKFEGALNERTLTLDREEPTSQETQRLVFTLLHENRFLYRYEVRPAGQPRFKRLYQVGATKEGVPFAGPGDNQPECIVSGGRGTMPVSYQGKTYYVCCSGCRDAFNEEPEKYIKEYEAKRKKK